jgi:hypothetical protein
MGQSGCGFSEDRGTHGHSKGRGPMCGQQGKEPRGRVGLEREREGGREGEREGEREGGREGGRERERERGGGQQGCPRQADAPWEGLALTSQLCCGGVGEVGRVAVHVCDRQRDRAAAEEAGR